MRKMMGGATLYLDGTIFAILDRGRAVAQGGRRGRRDLGRAGLREVQRHLQGRQGRRDELPPRAAGRLRRSGGDAALGGAGGGGGARGARRSAKPPRIVVPAKAGIPARGSRHLSACPRWVPAFAGMTTTAPASDAARSPGSPRSSAGSAARPASSTPARRHSRSDRIVSSDHFGPMKLRPTGSPLTCPIGTVRCG